VVDESASPSASCAEQVWINERLAFCSALVLTPLRGFAEQRAEVVARGLPRASLGARRCNTRAPGTSQQIALEVDLDLAVASDGQANQV
jgi:hypothetical protein